MIKNLKILPNIRVQGRLKRLYSLNLSPCYRSKRREGEEGEEGGGEVIIIIINNVKPGVQCITILFPK